MMDFAQEIYVAVMSSKTPKEIAALMSPNAREVEVQRVANFAMDAAEGFMQALAKRNDRNEDLLG